ncbi:fungal-specific transcription factor domain-containing protein [Fusarium avenaceum]|nr:fungal-specific transcription factor domain-containing protein [Fusarium avenaceum]
MPRFNTRRACDRCHCLKERCFWQQGMASGCSRCLRLGFECLDKRPSKRAGRPRLSTKPLQLAVTTRAQFVDNTISASPTEQYSNRQGPAPVSPLLRTISEFSDLSARDKQMMQNMFFSDNALDTFLIGPSFREKHRSLLISHFMVSHDTLKHAFLAVASGCEYQPTTEPYKHASLALKQLRQYNVSTKQDISECLALGAMIISFTYYWSPSPAAAPVCHQALGLIKDTYESSKDITQTDIVFISCLILPELLNCMMTGSLPSLKFRYLPELNNHVDRYIGLFAPLLPHFYDICKLNHALYQADMDRLPDEMAAVEEVERVVEAWQPQFPDDSITHFSAAEISHILCQAQVMRLGAMLLIYRLWHPFGTDNEPATALATSILTQLDLIQAATKRSIVYITLPLIAACFELHDEEERQFWLDKVPKIVGHSPGFSEYVQRLMKTFWKALDDVETTSWYNIGYLISLYE